MKTRNITRVPVMDAIFFLTQRIKFLLLDNGKKQNMSAHYIMKRNSYMSYQQKEERLKCEV